MNPSSTIEEAQRSNNKMEKISESKLLNFHISKSVFLLTGKKKAREKLQREVDTSPLMLCNSKMPQVECERYLGCWLDATAADPVATTIKKRIGMANKSIFEARIIVEDTRSEIIGEWGAHAGVSNI